MAHLDRLASPCSPPHCNSPTSHKVTTLFINWQCLNDQLSCFLGQWVLLPSVIISVVCLFYHLCAIYILDVHTVSCLLVWYGGTKSTDKHGHHHFKCESSKLERQLIRCERLTWILYTVVFYGCAFLPKDRLQPKWQTITVWLTVSPSLYLFVPGNPAGGDCLGPVRLEALCQC